ncbi:endoglucanase [Klenkia soli]|uniref:Glucanase n=1 Tax=Klenkia soli TaxID=1052260 RepID=A0A1H0M2J0_9ACTN|nr:glycosyl hydrolase family 8 [Klenkia soli]SDO74615.1 endoglucanase [Klenkia soli]
MQPDPSTSTSRRPGRRVLLLVAAALVVALAAGLVGLARADDRVAAAVDRVTADAPMSVGDRTALDALWRVYKETYLEPGTNRTLDKQNDDITTSEGQSYTMMRAVWSDDLATFRASWQWTKDNLQRPDFLMSWRFGERPDGTYGVQTEVGGDNTATDADVDIAFSLLMAYQRWQDDTFLYDALPIINSIWDEEVVAVGGRPVLVANDLEQDDRDRVLLNPSYFAPYAYRVFAEVDDDPTHDWSAVVDSSYEILAELDAAPLDTATSAGLAPDWVFLDRRTGAYSAVSDTLTTRFSYDALRSPWRLALDLEWNAEPRARALLEEQDVLADDWRTDGRLVAAYSRDGSPAADYEAPAMYGGTMGFFATVEPELATEVYQDELLPVYDADTGNLTTDLGYYDSNWVWFGMALYLDQLPDLTEVSAP